MRNNRLLVVAVMLIALGLIGIFTTTWFGSHRQPRRMFQMPGMMMDGMMGGAMMNRYEMKGRDRGGKEGDSGLPYEPCAKVTVIYNWLNIYAWHLTVYSSLR